MVRIWGTEFGDRCDQITTGRGAWKLELGRILKVWQHRVHIAVRMVVRVAVHSICLFSPMMLCCPHMFRVVVGADTKVRTRTTTMDM